MLGIRYPVTDVRELEYTDSTLTYPTLSYILNGAKRLRTAHDFTFMESTGVLTVPSITAGVISNGTLSWPSGDHFASTTGTINILDNDLLGTGQVAVGDVSSATLEVSGNSQLSGHLGVGGGWGAYQALINGTLGVTGASTLTGQLTTNGLTQHNSNVTVATGQAVTLQGSTTLSVAGTSQLTGLVGIGGAPSGYQLLVTGTLGVSGASTLTGAVSCGSTLGVTGASTFAGGKFSGNVGVGGSSTNAFPVDMGNSSTVQKLALYNNSSVFYGFGVGNNCITGTAGASSGSTTIGGLVFTSNNQLGINTGLNQADIGYRLYCVGTARITGATTLDSTLGVTGAATLSSTLGVSGTTTLAAVTSTAVTSPTYDVNYSSIPSFTSSQIGYNTSISSLGSFTGGSYTTLGTLSGVPRGCIHITFMLTYSATTTAHSGNISIRLDIQTSGGVHASYSPVWVSNYNVVSYVALDVTSGAWTLANDLPSGKILIQALTTGSGTFTPTGDSYLQITKIA